MPVSLPTDGLPSKSVDEYLGQRLAAFRAVYTGLGSRIHQFRPLAERFAAQRRPVELR